MQAQQWSQFRSLLGILLVGFVSIPASIVAPRLMTPAPAAPPPKAAALVLAADEQSYSCRLY